MVRQNKKRERGGGRFEAISFFFSPATLYLILSHTVSFSLSSLSLIWLFPFNDLQDTYCVFSFRLNFIGKNTPVSTDLMQERECEILF